MSDTIGGIGQQLGYDPDALREKYRIERDRRIRPEGNAQYREIAGEFSSFGQDPYVEQPISRAPLTDEVEVAVIGGGFGGLLAGARLRDAGIADIRMIESGADFGGTWYWNRYPGAACDIEALIYLPLLEETGYVPLERYTRAPEIFEHSRRIGRHYRLYDNACFQTTVTGLDWDEAANRWIISTNRGDAMRARYVIMSNGPLNRPKLPGIPGIETFKGKSFHTSRWDYDYTGGNTTGGLSKLVDKRVGVIGTGATAVQCVPHLAASAKELFVFQRTPSAVNFRGDRPVDADWVRSLEPGWQRRRMDNFNILMSGGYQDEDLVSDGWTEAFRDLVNVAAKESAKGLTSHELGALAEQADFVTMEKIRGRIDTVISDSAAAEALKPWYRLFCKRPCFHDQYLDAFNRPNVHLVDTEGQGVEAISGNSVIVQGKAYEVDCLIFATGFEVGTGFTRRNGYDIHGRDGLAMTQAWADGARSLHGIMVNQFPNLFMLGSVQGGFTANYPHNLIEQATHVAYVIDQAGCRQAQHVEATRDAEDYWISKIIAKANRSVAFQEACTPGYYNNEGDLQSRTLQNTNYGGGSIEYFHILEKWRQTGDLRGVELK